MSKQTNSGSNGGWFLSALTLLFIGLKLTGHITWSWVWVLSPLWIPIAFLLPILIFLYVLLK
jgi:hypothetical protein